MTKYCEICGYNEADIDSKNCEDCNAEIEDEIEEEEMQ